MIHVSHEIKSMVAQNCSGYTSRDAWGIMKLGNMAESCDTCSNYIRGGCAKSLFDDIANSITIN